MSGGKECVKGKNEWREWRERMSGESGGKEWVEGKNEWRNWRERMSGGKE